MLYALVPLYLIVAFALTIGPCILYSRAITRRLENN